MKDLTALLMGDPGVHPRRAPTQQEIEQMKLRTAHEQRRVHTRWSPLRDWKVGEVRTFATFREAKAKVSGLYVKGMCGSIRSKPDGTYTVTRMH